jgi:hypothetical protein
MEMWFPKTLNMVSWEQWLRARRKAVNWGSLIPPSPESSRCLKLYLADLRGAQIAHSSMGLLSDSGVLAGGCLGTETDVSSLILKADSNLLTVTPRGSSGI